MNAREFYDEFSSEIKEKKIWAETGEKFLTIFRSEPERFRSIVCGDIIPRIIEKNNLALLTKSACADVVGRLKRCEEFDDNEGASLGIRLSLWDMKIAVEYESSPAEWVNRLIKLTHLRCPLKVLICFSSDRKTDLDRLMFAAKCLMRIAAYDRQAKEEYVIIMGNAPASDGTPPEDFGWKSYEYSHEDRCFFPLIEEYEQETEHRETYKLDRFESIQKNMYERAKREIIQGRKKSHWMWYIFPQCKGLGSSDMAQFFSIDSIDEAKAYLAHPVLGVRLREITAELLRKPTNNPETIFGGIDSIKLRSSMTLFECAAPEESLFKDVLEKYFKGKRDARTLDILGIKY